MPLEQPLRLSGRSSSHYTRVAAMFAHELDLPFELEVVTDLTSLDAATYGGHPALKIPTLHVGGDRVFGADNICRRLAELAGRAHDPRVVLSEHVATDLVRSGQELVWQAMGAQVQLRMGIAIAKLPAESCFFAKTTAGMTGTLAWLDEHLEQLLGLLPAPRDLSVFELTLFCLVEHLDFQPTVSLDAFANLRAFATAFAERESARRTTFRFDPSAEPTQESAGAQTPSARAPDHASAVVIDGGYVLIIHAVRDFVSWKQVFDDAAQLRREAGERSYRLLSYEHEPNRIVHFSQWLSLAQARTFFESPRLVELRKQAGVEAPEFIYLHQLETGVLEHSG